MLIFSDRGNYRIAPLLRRGFRHVEVLRCVGGRWFGIGGVKPGQLEVVPLPDGFDPWLWAAEQGLSTLSIASFPAAPRRTIFALSTCVAVVKAVIGLNAPFVWTPWQLWKRLTRDGARIDGWIGQQAEDAEGGGAAAGSRHERGRDGHGACGCAAAASPAELAAEHEPDGHQRRDGEADYALG